MMGLGERRAPEAVRYRGHPCASFVVASRILTEVSGSSPIKGPEIGVSVVQVFRPVPVVK